jgi:hypothetical protein
MVWSVDTLSERNKGRGLLKSNVHPICETVVDNPNQHLCRSEICESHSIMTNCKLVLRYLVYNIVKLSPALVASHQNCSIRWRVSPPSESLKLFALVKILVPQTKPPVLFLCIDELCQRHKGRQASELTKWNTRPWQWSIQWEMHSGVSRRSIRHGTWQCNRRSTRRCSGWRSTHGQKRDLRMSLGGGTTETGHVAGQLTRFWPHAAAAQWWHSCNTNKRHIQEQDTTASSQTAITL